VSQGMKNQYMNEEPKYESISEAMNQSTINQPMNQ